MRAALHLSQPGLAQLVDASARQVSRWENGVRPGAASALRLYVAAAAAPESLRGDLAAALGVEREEADAGVLQTVAAPLPEAPSGAPAAVPASVREEGVDPLLLALAEAHDVLPRVLRTFGLALLNRVVELGVSPAEAIARLSSR